MTMLRIEKFLGVLSVLGLVLLFVVGVHVYMYPPSVRMPKYFRNIGEFPEVESASGPKWMTSGTKRNEIQSVQPKGLEEIIKRNGDSKLFKDENNTVQKQSHENVMKEFTKQPSEGFKSNTLKWDINFIPTSGFQAVGDSIQTHVYSAIYDDVESPIIRVITLVQELHTPYPAKTFQCTYYNETGHKMGTNMGKIQYVPEPKWGYKYRSGFINCQLPDKLMRPSVLRISENKETESNILRVIYPSERKWRLTRCFTALHSNFSDVMQFIQTMEISMMFGVEHFVVYNYSISSQVLDVMRKYQQAGVLDILPWSLPINKTDIHYYAQLAALQECLYRHLHVSEYIMTGDTDEIYVPHQTNNLLNMITTKLKSHPTCSALIVRNAFFPLNHAPHRKDFPFKELAEKLKLSFLLYTTHIRVHNPYDRSKLIIEPKGVEIAGIHNIEAYRRGKSSCVCQTDEVLLHHYRRVPANEMGSFREMDAFMHSYAKNITERVTAVLARFNIKSV